MREQYFVPFAAAGFASGIGGWVTLALLKEPLIKRIVCGALSQPRHLVPAALCSKCGALLG